MFRILAQFLFQKIGSYFFKTGLEFSIFSHFNFKNTVKYSRGNIDYEAKNTKFRKYSLKKTRAKRALIVQFIRVNYNVDVALFLLKYNRVKLFFPSESK